MFESRTKYHGPVGPLTAGIALVLVAVATTALWRVEVAWHGWKGLKWLEYFHWAAPIGIAMFVAWAALVAEVSERSHRRTGLLVAAVLAPAMYLATRTALRLVFVAGPTAMAPLLTYGPDGLRWLRYGALAWLTAIPLVVAAAARAVGVRVTLPRVVGSVLVFISSYPVGLQLIEILEPSVFADAIHTVKTGYVIPLSVIGLGLLFVPSRGKS